MKKGDILYMKVEKVDEKFIYATDNLNRLKIPAILVNFVEYVKPTKIDNVLSHLKIKLFQSTDRNNWQVSHYTAKSVVVWNKKTKKLQEIHLARESLNNNSHRFSGLWGLFAGSNLLNPDITTREKLDNSFQYQLEVSNKIEYQWTFFSYFYSLRLTYGRLEKPILAQGLDTIDFVGSLNWALLSTEYLRLYLGFGLGPVFLRTFKSPMSSASEITLAADLCFGMEYFIMPYVSIKTSVGYTLYSQDLAIDPYGFFSTRATIGYYFF